ncbi:MAG: hypothetical protein KGI75_23355 [Rhizobiaceae bacterium]|nr:hypothetical protein [Rhizobiaceae bacterium]
MISLLFLAILYLLVALVLVILIDRSVGIMFPASTDDPRAARRRPLPEVTK